MWILNSDNFVSIVQHDEFRMVLIVRARRRDDLERFLGPTLAEKYEILETPGADYQVRSYVPRFELGERLLEHVAGIDYGNFKASVDDDHRHEIYSSVWGQLRRLAPNRRWEWHFEDVGVV